MGFLEGKEARAWARRSPAGRQEAVTGCFARYFGPRAARPDRYVERDWMAEEFARGCAPQWNGYMEGAVRSGEAAAGTVAAL